MFTAGGVAGEQVTVGGALWRRGGKVCDGLAPAAAGFRGQAFGGSAGVFFLAGVPGLQDALVAGDDQACGEQHQRCQAHQAASAAADVVTGGIFDGGEAAFGAGAASVGAAVRGGGVVVLLPGFRVHPGRDSEGLPGTAGLRFSGGWRISGRSRSRVIEAGRRGQRILPMAAGHWTRW